MDLLKKDKWQVSDLGIYVSNEAVTGTAFTDDMQDELWNLEDDSWWFQYRADVIIGLIDRFFDPKGMILDIGGGNGYTSSVAKKRGYNVGLIEPSSQACIHAKKRGIENVYCGTVSDDKINDGSIEQFLLLDVLEHVGDDREFAKLLYKKTANNGMCIITVPAFMCLWSSEDNQAGHFRRYRIKELCKLLEECGFDLCYRSYFMSFLFLPILFVRVFLEKIGLSKKMEEHTDEEREKIYQSQFKTRSRVVDAALSFFYGIERTLMRKEARVPWGSSIIVAARKKDSDQPA